MRVIWFLSVWCVSVSWGAGSSWAQNAQSVTPSMTPPSITWYDYPEAQLRALDKITAEATTFKVKVGKPAKFGKIFMKVPVCRKPAPIDKLDSAAFVQVWEKPPKEEESKWVFSGWMFASSPSISAMDHPIYDVWLLDCVGAKPHAQKEPVEKETIEEETSPFDSLVKELDSTPNE